MLQERLLNGLEGFLVASLVVAVAFLVALVVRGVTKRQIGSPRYYSAALIGGFIIHRALIAVLIPASAESASAAVGGVAPDRQAVASLDAPFVAPAEDGVEQFPVQLERAMAQLPEQERSALSTAIEFLTFTLFLNLSEQDPAQFSGASESDLTARSLVRLYRYAQGQGRSMTLRKYIELSDEMKRQKPEWWSEFLKSKSAPSP